MKNGLLIAAMGRTESTNMSQTSNGALVVFGATGSVGSALARRLSKLERPLVLAARDATELSPLAAELNAEQVLLDACEAGAIENCIEATTEKFGGVLGIANCVGSILLKPAHNTSYEEWNDILTTNLTSSFSVVRAAGKAMRTSGGSVVLVSSAAAGVGTPNHEAIAAAKAGVEGLVRSAAATYANRGIRFNAVAPGLVKSKMTRKLWESAAAAAQSCDMHPLRRLGEPDEVAAAIAWLLDPAHSWITGQVLAVDGGLSNVLPRRQVKA